jgi:hypothetical protein
MELIDTMAPRPGEVRPPRSPGRTLHYPDRAALEARSGREFLTLPFSYRRYGHPYRETTSPCAPWYRIWFDPREPGYAYLRRLPHSALRRAGFHYPTEGVRRIAFRVLVDGSRLGGVPDGWHALAMSEYNGGDHGYLAGELRDAEEPLVVCREDRRERGVPVHTEAVLALEVGPALREQLGGRVGELRAWLEYRRC